MLKTAFLSMLAIASVNNAPSAMPLSPFQSSKREIVQVRGVCDPYGHCYNTGGHGNDVYAGPGGYGYGFDRSPPPPPPPAWGYPPPPPGYYYPPPSPPPRYYPGYGY